MFCFVEGNNYSPLQDNIIANPILFSQVFTSRLDIGCLQDIRCLGNTSSGEIRLEQTVLALQKDIGCFWNIRCL